MEVPKYFILNNGVKVPSVGLGTFQGDEGNSKVKEAVKLALRLGYRHIDGAAAYGNEREIGQGIKESGIPREEIFVTSKLPQTAHAPASVEKALSQTLKDADLDYVDLYLMHFPHAYKADEDLKTIRHPSGNGKPIIDYDLSRNYAATWKAMEALVKTGRVRSIGLSNFNTLKLKNLLSTAEIVPAVNQVELHPYLPQNELMEFSRRYGILLMAHQPLGGRPVGVVRAHADIPRPIDDPMLIATASRLGKSPAQIVLSWAVQKGIPVVPKSVEEHHLRQNLQLFRLCDKDFRIIENLLSWRRPVRYLDPSPHIGFNIFDEENDQVSFSSYFLLVLGIFREKDFLSG
ncbi:aldo-keto reductase [Nemania sp. FL0031]|nr:aldo-keto reductase [Nemania sp. FL0031]